MYISKEARQATEKEIKRRISHVQGNKGLFDSNDIVTVDTTRSIINFARQLAFISDQTAQEYLRLLNVDEFRRHLARSEARNIDNDLLEKRNSSLNLDESVKKAQNMRDSLEKNSTNQSNTKAVSQRS